MNTFLTTLCRERESYPVFFFAAAVEAAFAPLLLLGMRSGYISSPVGLPAGLWHAQEMIYGYTFAVLGGYLITRISGLNLLALMLLWLTGRAVWFLDHSFSGLVSSLAAGLFPLVLALVTSQKFKAAKRLRNRLFTYLLIALAILAALFHWFVFQQQLAAAYSIIYCTLYLICLLMITMGGRLIPPATIGALREQGQEVRLPFQPRLETAAMTMVFLLVLTELMPITGAWSAIVPTVLAVILLLRLSLWKTIAIRNNLAVFPLHLGYLWLAVGFGLLAIARSGYLLTPQDALHVITLGGIGTITLTMLLRVTGIRSKRAPPERGLLGVIHTTLVLSLLTRLLAQQIDCCSEQLLWSSAILWTVVFLLFLVVLLRPTRVSRRSKEPLTPKE